MAARRPHHTQPSEVLSEVTFAGLGLPAPLVRALAGVGVTAPFPIQAATLPDSLAGRDVLGRGITGSGKTYAFALPVLARLAARQRPRRPGRPRALILAPTRELATQIEAALAPLARALSLRTLAVFGGAGPRPQVTALRTGVDVLVACPGRLEDHLAAGHASLDAVEISVLDEADHMADLGFLPAVRRLLDQTPRGGQRLLFSATLDAGVDVLVRRYLRDPVTHHVEPPDGPAAMDHHVLHVHHDDRFPVLLDLTAAAERVLVFTRTKRRAKTLTRQLVAAGVPAVELHGNLAQNVRTRNLASFADGTTRTLVATDVAARGIHVDGITLVVHADPPAEHKAYLHRSGRTARAGARGTVVTLSTDDQLPAVRDLARRAGITPTTTQVRPGHPLPAELTGARGPTRPRTDRPIAKAPRPRRPAGDGPPPATVRAAGAPRRTGVAATVPSPRQGAAAFSAGSRIGRRGR